MAQSPFDCDFLLGETGRVVNAGYPDGVDINNEILLDHARAPRLQKKQNAAAPVDEHKPDKGHGNSMKAKDGRHNNRKTEFPTEVARNVAFPEKTLSVLLALPVDPTTGPPEPMAHEKVKEAESMLEMKEKGDNELAELMVV